jgi:hypothetical protein
MVLPLSLPKPYPNSLIASKVVFILGFHRFLSGLSLVIGNTIAIFSSPSSVATPVIYTCASVHVLCGIPCLVLREHRGAIWCAVMVVTTVVSDLIMGPTILALIWSSWGLVCACIVMLNFGVDLVVTSNLILAYFKEEYFRRRQVPSLRTQTNHRLLPVGGSGSTDFPLDAPPPYTICLETEAQRTTSSQNVAPPEYALHPPEYRDVV